MDYLVLSIILPEELSRYHVERAVHNSVNRQCITNLSKINIFIGPNNCGKSNLLRNLSKTEVLTYKHNINNDELIPLIKNCIDKTNLYLHNKKANGFREIDIDGTIDALMPQEYIDEGNCYTHNFDRFIQSIVDNSRISFVQGHMRYTDSNLITQELKTELSEIISSKPHIDEKINDRKMQRFTKLYIPTLRGLRGVSGFSDCYNDRTVSDYFNGGFCPEIFTGLGFYSKLKDLLLGDLADRQIVIDFQEFLSSNFFNRKQVALIPRKDSDVIYVKIGNEEEFPIYRLGDGIQSIICLTFPLFVNKHKKLLAFIEEPELYMHPGLQRVLINTLMDFENHQYFVTTHSNHFLDLTIEYGNISIYTFRKELSQNDTDMDSAFFKVKNVSNCDLNTLELLGVKNSSVFLSNCTIWVEGITDRKYLQHCLDLYYQKKKCYGKYKLDTHYSFVEYSGGNIAHWSFLDKDSGINAERLCGKLFLISDRDSKDTYKAERHRQLKRTLGNRYYVLSCREMENTLTPHVISSVIKKYEGDDDVLLPVFYQGDYHDLLLGRYVEDVLLKGRRKRNGKYADKSGTITQKLRFWDDAISEIKSFDDLSTEIQKLIKLVALFIEENNFE